ncbi:MAG: hypothetical protein FE78DRAFT_76324 [Acidomyces sp. 'richmondensis']|nr:MAG: hypothetical protein FE78DRAFT_76324 [Acidomyces sp. 'richmondensis']
MITVQTQPAKRTADAAGLKPGMRPAKSVKRRASKACQCCRARKVRCNVVEHGAPCTNCRLDEVECIVSESKRKKLASRDLEKDVGLTNSTLSSSLYTPSMLMNLQRLGQKTGSVIDSMPLLPNLMPPVTPSCALPVWLKALPARLSLDDIMYLEKKGALTIPAPPLRDELLRCYAEFVHPYMPLLNLHKVVRIIDRADGQEAMSLLLFQSIMFAGIATVDMRYLKSAGYETRRDARRDFFAKTRLLYDFDIEVDRISLIQSLLLMTYWYETPDDQKDSHHWMGIAVSLSHTIGLHRNPEKSPTMDLSRRRLWKRIWWSTYMRDRLVALGMRRPTRIKDADFDVPMLTLDDFEIETLPEGPSCIPQECSLMRDKAKQRLMAIMCIEKAKLCICISTVLSVQYSVLHNNHGVLSDEGSTRTTMMLVAKRLDPEMDKVQACDKALQEWHENLAEEARYSEPTWSDVDSGNGDLVLNLSLLHMIYYAALSALHRPQVLPSTAMPPRAAQSDQLEASRKAVRLAATEITKIANSLYNLDLVRFLPTTGITVLLPAIIIHLLDIKAPDEETRKTSLQGFCQCMQIMARLRDIYAAADYSTAFLEAAIRKAEIMLPQKSNEESAALTPPPDVQTAAEQNGQDMTDDEVARRLNTFLASTPPNSDHQPSKADGMDVDLQMLGIQPEFEPDFDSMVNLEAAGETWVLEDGAYAAMQGESCGFAMDMDWMKGIKEGGLMIPVEDED